MPENKVLTSNIDPSMAPELDMMCICCETVTRLLVKKGLLNWEDLADMTKLVAGERRKLRHTVKSAE